MVSARITPPTQAIAAINAEYARQPKLMALAYKRATSRLKSRMLKELRVEPGKPPRGITRLMTPRQRAAFFASKGFGKGIPYTRTHGLVKAWDVKVEASEKGGSITVTNNAPAAEFVYGIRRQPFLVAIGWLNPAPIYEKYEQEAATVLEETFFTVSSPDAGTSR